jgi:hypothetical protein
MCGIRLVWSLLYSSRLVYSSLVILDRFSAKIILHSSSIRLLFTSHSLPIHSPLIHFLFAFSALLFSAPMFSTVFLSLLWGGGFTEYCLTGDSWSLVVAKVTPLSTSLPWRLEATWHILSNFIACASSHGDARKVCTMPLDVH